MPTPVNKQALITTANALVANDKGLLAMDERNPTCNSRFAALGIPETVEARRSWRELIVTTPYLGQCVSGVILYDETIRQEKRDGTPFIEVIKDAGIIPGIKVDMGEEDMAGHPGERITQGLDGLRNRLAEYSRTGHTGTSALGTRICKAPTMRAVTIFRPPMAKLGGEDFIIDDETWTIRYMIVDTGSWTAGRKVLISPQWIERVSWIESKVFVTLSREAVRKSPEYTDDLLVTRNYEIGLHVHYHRKGYWVDEPANKEHA